MTGNEQFEAHQDGTELLSMVNKIMCDVEDYLQKTMAIVMADKTLHTFQKNPNVANDNYKSQFDAYVNVLEAYAGGITVPPDLVDGKLI